MDDDEFDTFDDLTAGVPLEGLSDGAPTTATTEPAKPIGVLQHGNSVLTAAPSAPVPVAGQPTISPSTGAPRPVASQASPLPPYSAWQDATLRPQAPLLPPVFHDELLGTQAPPVAQRPVVTVAMLALGLAAVGAGAYYGGVSRGAFGALAGVLAGASATNLARAGIRYKDGSGEALASGTVGLVGAVAAVYLWVKYAKPSDKFKPNEAKKKTSWPYPEGDA